jgi:plastocyanin domain-containing protein
MNQNKITFTLLLSLGLMVGTVQVSQAKMEMTESEHQFSRIEQPLTLKILVTLGGLGLIGAEVWWFLFSKTKSQQANVNKGIQELKIIVDGGYTPDRIKVNQGQPVRLNFLRKDSNSCLEKVLLPDFHKAIDLPLNQISSVEFTPEQAGEYTFHCGMNMFRGVLEVQNANHTKTPATNNHNSVDASPETTKDIAITCNP